MLVLSRRGAADALGAFLDGDGGRDAGVGAHGGSSAHLAVVAGRPRVGLSTLLADEARARHALHVEVPRAEPPVQLEALRTALRARTPGQRDASLAEVLDGLLRWSAQQRAGVLIDGFDRLVAADAQAPNAVVEAVRSRSDEPDLRRARLVVAGAARGVMRPLVAPGGALAHLATTSFELGAADFRTAARWMPDPGDLVAAARVFAVIGGVIGYATALVDDDLPTSVADVDRWTVQRVLSPAAALHDEATVVMATDPSLTGSDTLLQHSIVNSIASGGSLAARIAQDVGRPVSNLTPVLRRLVDAGVVVRREDPLRKQRPSYGLADPLVLFHHAVIEPHRSLLGRPDRARSWRERLQEVFRTRVRPVVFAGQARTWLEGSAAASTVAGDRAHVGPSSLTAADGSRFTGLVVADGHDDPSRRRVSAIATTMPRQRIGVQHLQRLAEARARIGSRASGATLLVFGAVFDTAVADEARTRGDVELVDLERLYRGD